MITLSTGDQDWIKDFYLISGPQAKTVLMYLAQIISRNGLILGLPLIIVSLLVQTEKKHQEGYPIPTRIPRV